MSKVKIVHLVNQLDFDGTSKVVQNLCELFSDDIYEIEVVSLTKNITLSTANGWPKNIKVTGFNYYYDPDYSLYRYGRLMLSKKLTAKRGKEIIEYIDSVRPDIVHAHVQPRELMICKCLNFKSNLLYTDHSTRIKEDQYKYINRVLLAWLYRRIYHYFHLVAVSQSVFNYHKYFKLNSKRKIHALIENKIQMKALKKAEKKESPIKVVYVARYEKKKDHKTLIKAWAKIRSSKKAELQLIGDGDYKEEILSLIEKNNFKYPVKIYGNVSNVEDYLQSADIAVFPSLNEGLSIALLEKMANALPVIASDIPEFQDLVIENKTGLIFKAGDADMLADKLELLIENEPLRNKLGEGARDLVKSKYDLNMLKTEYEEVYTCTIKS